MFEKLARWHPKMKKLALCLERWQAKVKNRHNFGMLFWVGGVAWGIILGGWGIIFNRWG